MEDAILTEGLQSGTHPLSFFGVFPAIPCLAQQIPQLVGGRPSPRSTQRLMWVRGQARSCRESGGPWLQPSPQACGPVSSNMEGREFSAKTREQHFPLPQSKQEPGRVKDEGNSLLIKTNLNQGNNELGLNGKRLASKHRDVHYRFGGCSVMFFPVLEAVSKWQISASSLQLFLPLPPALGREVDPLAQPQHHLTAPKAQAPSLPFSSSL